MKMFAERINQEGRAIVNVEGTCVLGSWAEYKGESEMSTAFTSLCFLTSLGHLSPKSTEVSHQKSSVLQKEFVPTQTVTMGSLLASLRVRLEETYHDMFLPMRCLSPRTLELSSLFLFFRFFDAGSHANLRHMMFTS